MSVTVITPSLPGRSSLRALALASVAQQTLPPEAHLIGIDYARRGSSAMRNTLARSCETDWIAPLDDDDILYPEHLERLVAAGDYADVVYPYCRVFGREWNPNREFDAPALMAGNYIPITTLIRRELIFALDGWRDSSQVEHGWEDWDFWLRALEAGARFVCVPHITWEYRFGNWNKTIHGEAAAR